jgi:ABC transporter DrrB family efflux protein
MQPPNRNRLFWFFHDTAVIFKRNMLHVKADPEQLLGLTIQPIMFVVLFRYVFGGAISTGSESYVNFLMAGIFVQSVAFGASVTGLTVATDMERGIMDRFRSLPMVKSSILSGTIFADMVKNILAVGVMILAGLLVGFRPNASFTDWVAAIGLLLFFSFSLSWVFAYIGLKAKSIQFVQQAVFICIFPLTFVSSAFVPTATMPPGLRVFAENQPLTQMVDAVRALLLGTPIGNHGWLALAWSVVILAIAFPLATMAFNKQDR